MAKVMNYHDRFGAPAAVEEPVMTGTTIMACTFSDGVVIGADSRTSVGSSYVANRVSDKLTKVTDYIYCCRSGAAADTQAVADIVSYHLAFYKSETGEEPLVSTAAALFRELCYNYRNKLTAGIIVAGWDRVKGGQVYMVPLGGMCVEQKYAMGGSGSTYIYGFTDANYREGMNSKECKAFIKQAIALAIRRDGSSGGVIRMGVITKDGIQREVVAGKDIPSFLVPAK
ncbi:proteasome subunit beta type-6 [Cimex lectularius]|uniref:proteasome endopeptidase complex n=1 Tax=Cimex lectularius TaxID=79782 RepID=A0A8I6RQX4_CIMLE|nr:proteasome subunit beta type-6 [Cimex lectularius]